MRTHHETPRKPRKRAARPASVVDIDPEDPSQQLDEAGQFSIEPLDIEAQPEAEREQDLDRASAEAEPGDEGDTPSQTTADAIAEAPRRDVGDLYGVHVPHAADRDLAAPEDRDSFASSELGENWLEAMKEKSIEGGAAPEHEVVILDDSDPDRPHHPSDHRDRPVADKGSGGTGGL